MQVSGEAIYSVWLKNAWICAMTGRESYSHPTPSYGKGSEVVVMFSSSPSRSSLGTKSVKGGIDSSITLNSVKSSVLSSSTFPTFSMPFRSKHVAWGFRAGFGLAAGKVVAVTLGFWIATPCDTTFLKPPPSLPASALGYTGIDFLVKPPPIF